MIKSQNFSIVHLLLLLLCAGFLIVGVLVVNDLSIYTPDSARYLIWANSLASFDGYKDGTLPEPQRYVIHAPLYSILLAPVERFFAYDVRAAKYFTLALGLIVLIALYRWISLKSGPLIGLLGSFLLVCNPLFLIYSTEILSEIPFAISLIAFFILFESYEPDLSIQPAWLFGIILAVTTGVLLRELGVALLFCAALMVFSKKNWKPFLVLILVPIVVYGIWNIRNEWIIGAQENPASTNTKYFFGHYFTLPASSLIDEFSARIMTNLRIYGALIPKIIFCTLYPAVEYKVINETVPVMKAIIPIVSVAKYFLGIITVAKAGWGVYIDSRKGTLIDVKLVFAALYFVIVLLYPINDLRFLFPLLILMIYYFCVSIRTLFTDARITGSVKYLIIGCVILFLTPNIVWEAEFAIESHRYSHLSLAEAGDANFMSANPWHFRQTIRYTGEWIVAHTPPDAVILSRRKEYVFWMGTRKIMAFDGTIPVAAFDACLRDYHVPYLIDVVQSNGMRQFEFQTEQSTHFSFPVACRYGNTVILQVAPKQTMEHHIDSMDVFAGALALNNINQYSQSSRQFDRLLARDTTDVAAMFYSGVAKEFEGKYTEAEALFNRITKYPQAGAFLLNALTHKTSLAALHLLQSPLSETLKSKASTNIAVQYWNEGFRNEACKMVAKAYKSDSTNLASSLYGIYFSLQERDTSDARHYLKTANTLQSDNPTIVAWKNYFSLIDSLNSLSDTTHRIATSIAIARQMIALGITESSIDLLLKCLEVSPKNIEALLMLSDLYISRERYLPASIVLRRVLNIEPANNIALTKLNQLRRLLE
ncbi:MAG: hypothetical protein ACHQQQ_07215 [Bacteroidota bacterium]